MSLIIYHTVRSGHVALASHDYQSLPLLFSFKDQVRTDRPRKVYMYVAICGQLPLPCLVVSQQALYLDMSASCVSSAISIVMITKKNEQCDRVTSSRQGAC